MSTRFFPQLDRKLGLGLGIDLHWGSESGFERDPSGSDVLGKRLSTFLGRYSSEFECVFMAFQPKNRNFLSIEDYRDAYDAFYGAASPTSTRSFHHTLLNLGSVENYDKVAIAEFTNAVTTRYDIRWINEDLGIWTLGGKTVPYPLPPFFTEDGLAACVRNVLEYRQLLLAPLVVEFPGLTEGTNFHVGGIDAFDYFRRLIDSTDAPVTLDTGHILSYQWLKGRTGERLLEGLERLPLGNCFEIHLSGCSIVGGKFRDLHHGVLLDEQLILLDYLLRECPNAKVVTYEDPALSPSGDLVPKSIQNFRRLAAAVGRWRSHP